MDTCPECYGKPRDDATCLACGWLASCRVYANLPPADPKPLSRHVSYEALTGGDGLPGCDEIRRGDNGDDDGDDGRKVFSVDDMAVLVRLLLTLDDYELRIMQQVIHGRYTSLSELARVFGISKQAMHRKLTDACAAHPQLASLLGVHLRRCRRILECRKARPNQRRTEDARQLTLDLGI